MPGFRKAKPQQAALKFGFYGPQGSGKTFTALLCAEGVARVTKKRIAFVDTEHGTDFYAQKVERAVHPEAFDFDAIYTRSITEVLGELRRLKFEEHGIVVIDSVTHLWEATKAAYSGKTTKIGSIPLQAWGHLKKPYKDLMHLLINSPFHVFILGRQGNDFAEDEETGELKSLGYKMKAEGETAYEPHTLIRMETARQKGKGKGQASFIPSAVVEKDRTGLLQGKVIDWPDFDSLIRPMLHLLGDTQAVIESDEDTAGRDAEAIGRQQREREHHSKNLADEYAAKFKLAKSRADVEAVSKSITADLKKQMLTSDVDALREAYRLACEKFPKPTVDDQERQAIEAQ